MRGGARNQMMWAYTNDSFTMQEHRSKFNVDPKDHGAFFLIINDDMTVADAGDKIYNYNLWRWHAWVLWAAWGPLALL